MKYPRDFEVDDMVVVTEPGRRAAYLKGQLGFIASLDDKSGVAWVYFDITRKNKQKAICYEEIEKFNPEKDY